VKRILYAIALSIAAWAAWAQTTLAPGSYTLPAGAILTIPTPVVVAPPPVVVPSPAAYIVYANGKLGGGDGNWIATFDNASDVADYTDTTGKPQTGTYDLKFTGGTEQWPIWMPYANNPPKSFSMAGYTTVQFDIKTTVAADVFNFYFVPAGDEACPTGLTCSVALPNVAYGPAVFAPGVWYHITIPLSVVGVPKFPGADVFKFGVQEDSGKLGVPWYGNNFTFQ
jgi:hypothetical protein